LIKRGADVEHRDKKGFSPLILAATGGHTEVCKILLEHGCKVDAQSERTKDTALSLACSGGRKEVIICIRLRTKSCRLALKGQSSLTDFFKRSRSGTCGGGQEGL
jgi:ankyrin repeat protein